FKGHRGARGAPVVREERYCSCRRGIWSRQAWWPLDESGDALLDLGGELRARRAGGLHGVLELHADVLDLGAVEGRLRADVADQRADLAADLAAALAQLALDARTRALGLALQRAAGLGATALELVELGLELALGLRARVVLRVQLAHRADDVVAG